MDNPNKTIFCVELFFNIKSCYNVIGEIMQLIMIISSVTLLIDQIVKIMISFFIPMNSSIPIISNFFSITYVRNYGAAFSILNGNTVLLIIVSILSLFLIYHFLIKDKNLKRIEKITYGLLIGGLLGNLLDRIVLGYVIDYLSFHIFGYDFPIFNIADISIVLSTIIIILILGSDESEIKIRRDKKTR